MRKITVATGALKHPTFEKDEVRPDSPKPLLEEAEVLIEEAALRKCDILCLPECLAQLNRSNPSEEVYEPSDGPINTFVSERSKKHNMIIIATINTTVDGKLYNRGVIYDRTGKLAGTYDKVHLPGGECNPNEPGKDFTITEVEGIKIGMQTCYDLNFPEGCRVLALRGADIIFWPNMWGGMPEHHTEITMRSRAMENHVFLVSAAYFLDADNNFREPKVYGRSCIIDWAGTILAEVGRRTGIAIATIDLDELRNMQVEGQKGLYASRIPECYGPLTEPRGK